MGWLGDALKGIAGVATKFIPGPVDDFIVDAASRAIGGSGQVSNRAQKGQPWFQKVNQVPTSGPLAPVGRQQRPTLPDIDIGMTVNPPMGGSRGAGVTTYFGPSRTAAPARQQSAGATLPIVGAIATEPEIERIDRRDCGPGRVLAMDGLCYPKRMLPASFRMHPPAPKPVVSAADRKAIRKANAAKKRLVKLTKDAGAHASLTKPRRK